MPIMFPGRGTPTMRWRNSPARQMANMTASWRGILMVGVNVEKVRFKKRVFTNNPKWLFLLKFDVFVS